MGAHANPTPRERNNGAILNTSTIMRNVMSLAAEAECSALFNNHREAIAIRNTLEEMGHTQPPTTVQVDNTTAVGFANQQIKQKQSKSMDMRFYWIQDRVDQRQFLIFWGPGASNLADYFTKHHPPSHHRRVRSTYLHTTNHTYHVLRGCVHPDPELDPELETRTQMSESRTSPRLETQNLIGVFPLT